LIFEQLESVIKELDFTNEMIEFINKNIISNLIKNEENEY
jgi:hypothetical protein